MSNLEILIFRRLNICDLDLVSVEIDIIQLICITRAALSVVIIFQRDPVSIAITVSDLFSIVQVLLRPIRFFVCFIQFILFDRNRLVFLQLHDPRFQIRSIFGFIRSYAFCCDLCKVLCHRFAGLLLLCDIGLCRRRFLRLLSRLRLGHIRRLLRSRAAFCRRFLLH